MDSVLKIAVDARPMAFPNNGIGRYLGNILRELALAETPHRFLLYCDRPFEPRFPLPAHWAVRTGNVNATKRSTAFAQTFFPTWAVRDKIDVFWSPRHQLPLLLPPRSRKVLTVHDVVWKAIPETMPREAVALEALLMPMSLRLADQVITDSHFSRSEILSYFPKVGNKLDVVYLASNLKADGPAAACPLDKPYFLTVGSYEPRKNMERMLHAYIQYRQLSAEPLDLVIVGTEQWGNFSARKFVQSRNLESCVHLMQRAEDAVLRALYANARALVLVSLYEGFGLPVVEAMQYGIPVLTSNTSSLVEIAGDAALLVNPLDTDAIAQALQRISEDEAIRRELAQRGPFQAKQFSWSRAAAQTIALLVGDLAGEDPGMEAHEMATPYDRQQSWK